MNILQELVEQNTTFATQKSVVLHVFGEIIYSNNKSIFFAFSKKFIS